MMARLPWANAGYLMCGRQPQYIELRTKQVPMALGPTRIGALLLCRSFHRGQFPADRELGVQGSAVSPGVRPMMGLIGHEWHSTLGAHK
jgi:hypothetical protein